MKPLVLNGDAIELDGVALFRATPALTPAMRMRLEDDGMIATDGSIRSPLDSLNPTDEFTRGTRNGIAIQRAISARTAGA